MVGIGVPKPGVARSWGNQKPPTGCPEPRKRENLCFEPIKPILEKGKSEVCKCQNKPLRYGRGKSWETTLFIA